MPALGGWSSLNVAITFGMEKLVWCIATDGEKILRICLAVSTEYRRTTDRRTDKHLATARSALRIASRGKKKIQDNQIAAEQMQYVENGE